MFAQFFGAFLLNNKLVSPDTLAQAIDDKKNTRMRLGVLAINAGLMTADQVEHVNVAQQSVDKRFGDLCVDLGYLTKADVDRLLSTHPSFMLGPWIEDARAWGSTPAEKDYFEQQARTILTIWGGPVLNDYANRMWGGLVKDYYTKRWDMFFREVMRCARQGKSFDEKAFDEKLSAFEQDWTRRHTHYAVSPRKNTRDEALKIYSCYMSQFYGEVR